MSDSSEEKINWKTLRTDLGLTQKAVALAIGCHVSDVSAYETGKYKPTAEKQQKLLDFYLSEENLALKKQRANGKSNLRHLPVGSIDSNQMLVSDRDTEPTGTESDIVNTVDVRLDVIDKFVNGDLLLKSDWSREFYRATKL